MRARQCPRIRPAPLISVSTECRELLLHTAVPILEEMIKMGEEEEACIDLLSNTLEVLYKAEKVDPAPPAGPAQPCPAWARGTGPAPGTTAQPCPRQRAGLRRAGAAPRRGCPHPARSACWEPPGFPWDLSVAAHLQLQTRSWGKCQG